MGNSFRRGIGSVTQWPCDIMKNGFLDLGLAGKDVVFRREQKVKIYAVSRCHGSGLKRKKPTIASATVGLFNFQVKVTPGLQIVALESRFLFWVTSPSISCATQ